MNDKRLKWADISKGLGIILVKIGHKEKIISKQIIAFIYSFHMPLFFLISGFFISQKYIDISFWRVIKSKVKSLLVPYFIYSIIMWIIYLILDIYKYSLDFINHINYKSLIGIFFRIPNTDFSSDHWFFWTLFNAEIIFIFFLKITKNKKSIYIPLMIAFSILFYYLNQHFGLYIINNIDLSFVVLPFIMFGYIMKEYYSSIHKIIIKYRTIVLLMCFQLLLIYVNYRIGNKHIDYNNRFFNEYFTLILSGLVGSVYIISISSHLKKASIIEYIGKNSLIYYLVSWIGEAIIIKVFNILNYNCNSFLSFIMQIIFALVFPVPIIFILNKIKEKKHKIVLP